MHAIQSTLLRAADRASLAFQGAGKVFGFLEDGRDLVRTSGGEADLIAILPNHADEGWPELRIPLPPAAVFRHAANGPLSRIAVWIVDRPEAEVVSHLMARGLGLDADSDGGFTAPVGPAATIRIRKGGPGATMVAVRQSRAPEMVSATLGRRAGGL